MEKKSNVNGNETEWKIKVNGNQITWYGKEKLIEKQNKWKSKIKMETRVNGK